MNREAADEFGDQAVAHQVFNLKVVQQFSGAIFSGAVLDICTKADSGFFGTLLDNFL